MKNKTEKVRSAWSLEDSMKNNFLCALKWYWNRVLRKVNTTWTHSFEEQEIVHCSLPKNYAISLHLIIVEIKNDIGLFTSNII